MICEFCNKEISDRYYKRHIRQFHTNIKYENCPYCDKQCRDIYLSRHIRYNHTDPEYREKQDNRTKDWAKNNKEAKNAISYKWKLNNPEKNRECNKNYRSREEVKEKINKLYKERVICDGCGKEMNQHSLARHKKTVCGKVKITKNPTGKSKSKTPKKVLSEIDKLRIKIEQAEKRKAIKRNLQIKENVILEF
tara:strand:- start:1152 stop:1730 length:579 start_codon:yes stop_codon:yes gene_type:complete